MKLTASLLVVFTLFYCTCAHVSYSNWRLIDTVCRRPNSGECAKAGTCCGKRLSGTQRLERDCEHDACPPDMLEKTQGCTIRCGDADATAYGAWVRAGNCERPSSGACAAEDTCCGQREGTMKHTRECNAANGCDAPTLERHFKCNVRCGFVNPCRLYPNPCENGGTCVEDGHSHSCTCASGWTGHHCDEDVDECASEPCQNGGTCTDGVNTYSCDCADGFSGGDCSTNVDECASEPCQNGGACTDGDNTYSCDCADGFSGGDCSTKDVVEDEDNGEWCTDPLKSSQDATDFPGDLTNLGYANNYAYVWTSEGGEYADIVAHCAKFNAKPAHHNMDSFESRQKIIDSFNKEDVFDQLWIGMEIKDGAWQYIDGSTGDFVWGSWEAANGATTPDFSYDGNNGLINNYPGQKDHLKSSYWNDESYGFYHGLCEIECPSAPADDTPEEEPVPPATPLCSDATWLQAGWAQGEDNTGDGYSPWNGGQQDSQEACYQKCIEMTKTYPDINAIGYGIEGRSVKSCSCYPASTGFTGEWKASDKLGAWGTNRVFCMMPEAEESKEGGLIPGVTCWEEGKQFMGTTFDTTASGKKCDVWTNDMGKNWHYYDDNGEYDSDSYNSFLEDVGGAESGNLCRNYALDPKGPYCFVGAVWQSPSTVQDLILRGNPLSSQDHFEYCDIPKCPTEEPELVCDVGFQQENSCYFRINAKTNYANAKTACEEQGAQLAHFSSPDTVTAVLEYLVGLGYGDYHWTGGDGSYIGTSKSKTITWLNGEQYTTEFWYSTSYPKEAAVRTHFALVADPYNRGKEGFMNVAPTWGTPYPLCVTDAAESTESKKEELIRGETCWVEGEQFMGTTVDSIPDGTKCHPWTENNRAWHYYDNTNEYNYDWYDPAYEDVYKDTAGSYCRNYMNDPNGPYCFIGEVKAGTGDVRKEIAKGNYLTKHEHFAYCGIPKCP